MKNRKIKFSEEMPKEDEELVIMCRRVSPGETHGDIETATIRECGECGSPVWFAPSSERIEKKRGVKIRCMECSEKEMGEEEEVGFIKPTPEQLREIEEQLRRNARRKYLN